MEHKGRKPIYDDSLVIVSLSLRRDQRDYLRTLNNASDLMRRLLDDYIETENGKAPLTDIIAMRKRMSALERQLKQLTGSIEYKRALYAEDDYMYLSDLKAKLQSGENGILRYNSDRHYLELRATRWLFDLPDDSDERRVVGWTQAEIEKLLTDNGVKIVQYEGLTTLPPELAVTIIDRMLPELALDKAVKAEYDKRIAELKEAVEALKHKILEQAGTDE